MNNFRRGLAAGIPIALGYLSVAFTFGIMAVSYGLTWWQALLISMTTLTSAGQFAGIGIMIHPGQYIQMLISQITINIRYSFMAISIGQKADSRFKGIYRWLLGFLITDEIFAVATQEENIKRSFFAGLATLPYIGWALGTLIGAIMGNVLPDRLMSALSLAIYGMFVAVVVPQMKQSRPVVFVVITAVILSCLFYYVPALSKISSGITITIVAITAAVIGSILFPIPDEHKDSSTDD
ncbi:MAG: AzlC family ABC transporter permease [Clostridia bacterium]|nr:AzlC family ABC transporter permease [Clostridia bacterium]